MCLGSLFALVFLQQPRPFSLRPSRAETLVRRERSQSPRPGAVPPARKDGCPAPRARFRGHVDAFNPRLQQAAGRVRAHGRRACL